MTYQEALVKDMQWLAKKKDTIFLGQGIAVGDRMYKTFSKVPTKKCIEMPVAENLIQGVANGMALVGYVPVVVYQRMDFMLIGADQIINHLALIPTMSGYQFKPHVIIRTCIGSRDSKFDVGLQHKHDFRHIFKRYITTVNYEPGIYQQLYDNKCTAIVVEERDKYAGKV